MRLAPFLCARSARSSTHENAGCDSGSVCKQARGSLSFSQQTGLAASDTLSWIPRGNNKMHQLLRKGAWKFVRVGRRPNGRQQIHGNTMQKNQKNYLGGVCSNYTYRK